MLQRKRERRLNASLHRVAKSAMLSLAWRIFGYGLVLEDSWGNSDTSWSLTRLPRDYAPKVEEGYQKVAELCFSGHLVAELTLISRAVIGQSRNFYELELITRAPYGEEIERLGFVSREEAEVNVTWEGPRYEAPKISGTEILEIIEGESRFGVRGVQDLRPTSEEESWKLSSLLENARMLVSASCQNVPPFLSERVPYLKESDEVYNRGTVWNGFWVFYAITDPENDREQLLLVDGSIHRRAILIGSLDPEDAPWRVRC